MGKVILASLILLALILIFIGLVVMFPPAIILIPALLAMYEEEVDPGKPFFYWRDK